MLDVFALPAANTGAKDVGEHQEAGACVWARAVQARLLDSDQGGRRPGGLRAMDFAGLRAALGEVGRRARQTKQAVQTVADARNTIMSGQSQRSALQECSDKASTTNILIFVADGDELDTDVHGGQHEAKHKRCGISTKVRNFTSGIA